MTAQCVSSEWLREHLSYDVETGIFLWRAKPKPTYDISKPAGSLTYAGYLNISIKRRLYKAHRLAWLYVTGEWPKHQIDHVNGVRHDNRFVNLRDVTNSVNNQNLRAPQQGSSGYLGVSFSKRNGKWRSAIWVNKKHVYLGEFKTPEEAHERYLTAKRELHAGCTI